jgi:transcriptional regulator with XRE-family HTH domain
MGIYAGINATMVGIDEAGRRRELGAFVRTQREKLTPTAAGLIGASTRRRTPGLRREEAAQLCGLSATWYTWIEQGRDVAVSPAALARLAVALQLGRAERAYLFELAGRRDRDRSCDQAAEVPLAVLACIGAITCPAYVLDRTWTARGWNTEAGRLFVGWLDCGDRNLLRYIFLAPAARALIRGWEERARRVAAEFRAACGPRLDDPLLAALVAELRHGSVEFARLWDGHGVLAREGGERTFNHPKDGLLAYEQVTFDVAGRPDLKMTMLVGPHPTAR